MITTDIRKDIEENPETGVLREEHTTSFLEESKYYCSSGPGAF